MGMCVVITETRLARTIATTLPVFRNTPDVSGATSAPANAADNSVPYVNSLPRNDISLMLPTSAAVASNLLLLLTTTDSY